MKRERVSLNVRLLMVQLGSLCLALAIFFGGMTLGSWVLNTRYLSPEATQHREQNYVRKLNQFVQENALSSDDGDALAGWVREQKYVYLAVYREETPILETDGYDTTRITGPSALAEYSDNLLPAENYHEITPLTPDADGHYRVQFADGTFCVSLQESSHTPYYDLVVIGALVLACLAMLLVNLTYNRHITRAIIRLSKEVQWVEEGSSDAVIQSSRQDEIGDLARAVERMRRSIIQRMQGEQEAWAANSGLITAISHDVRTPLTALMGYLDLLEGKQYQSEEQMSRYISAGRQKAQQLKELTDELFRYFLVFASPEMKLHPQVYDAPILLEQLLGERVILLQEAGFAVQTTMLQQSCQVTLDVQYLQRVLDNLFSNIHKHADKQKPVHVLARVEGKELLVDLSNSVPPSPNKAESTKIGLQTCRKILREMGGRFETCREEDKFLAEIALPLTKAEEMA